MKIYIAAGIVTTSIVLIVSTAILLSDQEEPVAPQQPQTTVSSSTQATSDNNDDSNSENRGEKTNTPKVDTNKASYTKFTAESFRAVDGQTRVLFFYDSAHTPSVRLDEMLTKEVKALPDKVHIFKTEFKEQKNLGAQYGVTEPGASLKFDSNSQLTAVYIATDSPDISTYKKVLSLK
ncbi:hypothetical protein I8H83_00410 [Candidatus Saccharibacteria bacterium]|nr:hypothetical protein [Candidatus Saccharibacteria bacterium]